MCLHESAGHAANNTMPLFKPPTTEATRSYYRELWERKRNPLFWGTRRFDPAKAFNSPSLTKHFLRVIDPLIKPGDRVLDLGCGSGMFLPAIYQRARDIHAVDTSPTLLGQAQGLVAARGLSGIVVREANAEQLPYADSHFDALIAVDVLHHFERFNRCLEEMWRVVKPGGTLIIFEPNKLNPLLALGCLLDRNEWGLLALGRPALYRRKLSPLFSIQSLRPNGLIIGPDWTWVVRIADLVTRPPWAKFLGWLAPKIVILAKKPHS